MPVNINICFEESLEILVLTNMCVNGIWHIEKNIASYIHIIFIIYIIIATTRYCIIQLMDKNMACNDFEQY